MKRFIISGERIDIGFLTKENIPAVMDFFERNRERIARFNPPLPETYSTPGYWEDRVRFQRSALKRERAVDFYLFLPDRPGRVVGHVRLSNIEAVPRSSCEIGYTVDGLLEGGGYMAEAIGLALSFAKNGLDLHRVYAFCHPGNLRSKKLLAALGFREEGVLCESMRMDAIWQDMLLFARLL